MRRGSIESIISEDDMKKLWKGKWDGQHGESTGVGSTDEETDWAERDEEAEADETRKEGEGPADTEDTGDEMERALDRDEREKEMENEGLLMKERAAEMHLD